MSITEPPLLGQDPWGENLNGYLAYLEGRIVVLEGDGGGGGDSLMFEFTDGGSAGRAAFPSGSMRFDTADQTQATADYASVTTSRGADARPALMIATPGTVLAIRQTDDPTQYALATVSDTPIDQGDHIEIPLSSMTVAAPLTPGTTSMSAVGIAGGSDGAGGAEHRRHRGSPGPCGRARSSAAAHR